MEGLFYYYDSSCSLLTVHRLLFTITCTSIGRFANRPYNRTQQPSYQYREPLLTLRSSLFALRSSLFAFHFSLLTDLYPLSTKLTINN